MFWLKWTAVVVGLMAGLLAESMATVNKVQEADNNSLEHKTAEKDFRPAIAIARQYPPQYGGPIGIGGGIPGGGGGGCPLCDSSVYSYCSHRVLHDSCCCDFAGSPFKPPQCLYLDCSQLYAKSCYEFSLIKNCCCNNPY